jgi:hypothetical protein
VIAPPAVAERASPPRFFMAVGGGALDGLGYGQAIPNEQLADFTFAPRSIATSELSWLVFTLIRTVPSHIDKPGSSAEVKGISHNGIAEWRGQKRAARE